MNFYYDVFGGSLRNLRSVAMMDQHNPYPKDIFEVVQAEMISFFGGFKLAGVSKATWDKTAQVLAKKLKNPNEGSKNSSVVDPNTITRITPSIDLPPETPVAKVVPHFPSPRCRNKVEWSAAVEARTTGHHFPIRLTTAPYDQRGKCVVCNKKAQFKCRHCGVYLHLSHHNEVGCWDAFHSDLSL